VFGIGSVEIYRSTEIADFGHTYVYFLHKGKTKWY